MDQSLDRINFFVEALNSMQKASGAPAHEMLVCAAAAIMVYACSHGMSRQETLDYLQTLPASGAIPFPDKLALN